MWVTSVLSEHFAIAKTVVLSFIVQKSTSHREVYLLQQKKLFFRLSLVVIGRPETKSCFLFYLLRGRRFILHLISGSWNQKYLFTKVRSTSTNCSPFVWSIRLATTTRWNLSWTFIFFFISIFEVCSELFEIYIKPQRCLWKCWVLAIHPQTLKICHYCQCQNYKTPLTSSWTLRNLIWRLRSSTTPRTLCESSAKMEVSERSFRRS